MALGHSFRSFERRFWIVEAGKFIVVVAILDGVLVYSEVKLGLMDFDGEGEIGGRWKVGRWVMGRPRWTSVHDLMSRVALVMSACM